jgi:hypothetical protein
MRCGGQGLARPVIGGEAWWPGKHAHLQEGSDDVCLAEQRASEGERGGVVERREQEDGEALLQRCECRAHFREERRGGRRCHSPP